MVKALNLHLIWWGWWWWWSILLERWPTKTCSAFSPAGIIASCSHHSGPLTYYCTKIKFPIKDFSKCDQIRRNPQWKTSFCVCSVPQARFEWNCAVLIATTSYQKWKKGERSVFKLVWILFCVGKILAKLI